MVRRTLLGSLAAVLGAFGRGAAAREPTPTDPKFPFPITTVSGVEAMATWRRLKAEGQGSPVVLGDDDSLLRLIEGLEYAERTTEEVLRAAAGLVMPDALIEERERERQASDAYYAGEAGLPKPTVVGVGPNGERVEYTDAQVQAMRAEERDGPDLGDWPEDDAGAAADDFPLLPMAAFDLFSSQPLARVHIALVPTLDPTEIPAYLQYGAWNDCPPPEFHVAFLRRQRDRHGAQLVALGVDTLELEAGRLPTSREEAIALAREFHVYCEDTINQGFGTVSAYARALMASRWRYFWWD